MVPVLLALVSSAPVSVSSLLPEMSDLERLARRPEPRYFEAQSSSFDRAALKGDPFANGDAGKFLRTEEVDGRKEFVMADLKGPGAVVRVWSANPSGTIQFYFDGEKAPRLKENMADLLTGKKSPFTGPFSYMSAQGTNLYFPFPYERSLKITAEGPVQGLYYHVNYRSYDSGTAVNTFDWKAVESANALMDEQSRKLLSPGLPDAGPLDKQQRLAPGRTATLQLSTRTPSAVRTFAVKIPFPIVQTFREMDWTDPHQPHNVLRNLLLRIKFDGEETVRAPLGDFFATAPGVNPSHTLPFEVQPDGLMVCRFVMPFRKSVQVEIENTGPVEVPIQTRLDTKPFRWDDKTYLFHAQWKADHRSTRPMWDMNFLDVKGEGTFVGSNLQISNPSPAWWGEGDEKFYLEGESVPSTFGTGTEDYYGYAWCSPQLFDRPYHAQPRCDGPGNRGQTQVMRWHVFDAVPFRNSFKFDLEMWHWADLTVTAARTAYWYARPGTTSPVPVDRSLLAVPEIERPKPVPGAIEGETLEAKASGGNLTVQGGFWQTSRGEQRWWTNPAVGDSLTFTVPVAESGEYEIVGNFCHAVDYGIHELSLNGRSLGTFDFFSPDLEWRQVSLGTVVLEKGNATLKVECKGANAQARPGRMFGLDYLSLRKK
jgi:hypothetical protein